MFKTALIEQVHKLAESKYREWKEKEAKDMLEKVRQQHHFESTWRTGSIEIFRIENC